MDSPLDAIAPTAILDKLKKSLSLMEVQSVRKLSIPRKSKIRFWWMVLFVVSFCHASRSAIGFAQSDTRQAAQSQRNIEMWVELKNPLVKAPHSITVAAGVRGIIEVMHSREGDHCSPGTPIAKIRCDDAEMQVQRAELALLIATLKSESKVDLQFARKSSEVAQQELARMLRANEIAKDTYPPNEVDRYRLLAEKAALEIERADVEAKLNKLQRDSISVELAQAKRTVERHTITAPEEAVVVEVFKNGGEWVEPSDKLMEIISTKKLRVEGLLESSEAVRVKRGCVANVAFPSKESKGVPATVSFVSPVENPVNRQVKVFIDLDNSLQTFRPGMSLHVKIAVE